MRKPNGDPSKSHKLSRKTILNIVGVCKLIPGKKVSMTWELIHNKDASPKNSWGRRGRRPIPRPVRVTGRHHGRCGRDSLSRVIFILDCGIPTIGEAKGK
jgi:hypothetical protein